MIIDREYLHKLLAQIIYGRPLIVECGWQASGHKATADIPDRIAMASQGLGNGLVLQGSYLVAIQEQQNPGSGVRPGPSAARADQSIECGTLVVCKGNG